MKIEKEQLKEQIIEALNLEGMTPADINDDAPLFGEGLGLDSIDALELMMVLDKHYGIKLTDRNESKKVFASVNTMVEFIESKK